MSKRLDPSVDMLSRQTCHLERLFPSQQLGGNRGLGEWAGGSTEASMRHLGEFILSRQFVARDLPLKTLLLCCILYETL